MRCECPGFKISLYLENPKAQLKNVCFHIAAKEGEMHKKMQAVLIEIPSSPVQSGNMCRTSFFLSTLQEAEFEGLLFPPSVSS